MVDGNTIRRLWTHKTQDHPWPSDEDLVIDRAEGVWVWTQTGKKLLDGFAGLAVVNVGHGRREIAEAIAEQTVRLAYYPTTRQCVVERVGQAGAQRQGADVPVRNHARRHQRGEDERRARHRRLGGHEQAAPGHAVGDDAAGDGEQQYRAPVQQVDEPQQQRRVRKRQDQPGLGH
jgi:hypothetical protein